MKSTNIISNTKEAAPIPYEIKTSWGSNLDRSFKLTIFRLPDYSPKIPSNDVIDISDHNNLLGFTNELAIGLGTYRLALPAISTKDKEISLNFGANFLRDMKRDELLLLQTKIAETLNFLNFHLMNDSRYFDTIGYHFEY